MSRANLRKGIEIQQLRLIYFPRYQEKFAKKMQIAKKLAPMCYLHLAWMKTLLIWIASCKMWTNAEKPTKFANPM